MIRTPEQMLAYVEQQIAKGVRFPRNGCQKQSRLAYAVESDGTPTAAAGIGRSNHFHRLASVDDIPGNVPLGGLLRWSGGSTGAGHVAPYRGHGFDIFTTDYPGEGRWNAADARALDHAWSALHFEGWDQEIDGVLVVPDAHAANEEDDMPLSDNDVSKVADAVWARLIGGGQMDDAPKGRHAGTVLGGIYVMLQRIARKIGA